MSLVREYVDGLDTGLKEVVQQDVEGIANIIFDAYTKCNQVFIMGNGGSASTASHFARDLSIGTAIAGKTRLKVSSLTDNVALITAVANDTDYSFIFLDQLIAHLNKGDIVIGISASGNSPNVLKAIEYARQQGAITIGLVGFGGGQLKELAHKSIILSIRDYGIVEDVHLCLAHMISYLVKEKLANAA